MSRLYAFYVHGCVSMMILAATCCSLLNVHDSRHPAAPIRITFVVLI